MTEREIIDALQKNSPFSGIQNLRMGGLELQPKGGFDVVFRLEFGLAGVAVYGEIKNNCTPKLIKETAPWLARLKATKPDSAFALICPALSPEAQRLCLENGIDFIDLAGNFSINVPGKFFLQKLGQKTAKTLTSNYQSPFAPKASRILRVLLENPMRAWTLTEITKELLSNRPKQNRLIQIPFEVSLGAVSKTLTGLEEELLIRRQAAGILVPEPRRLLLRWAEKYKERYRWYLRSSFKTTNPFGENLPVISKGLAEMFGRSTEFAFTGASATAITAPFVDAATIDVFVSSPEGMEKIRQYKSTVELGPNIRIMLPYDIGVFMYSNLVNDLPLVSDIQTYLDLYAQGGRDFKQAEYLFERRIQPRWEKV